MQCLSHIVKHVCRLMHAVSAVRTGPCNRWWQLKAPQSCLTRLDLKRAVFCHTLLGISAQCLSPITFVTNLRPPACSLSTGGLVSASASELVRANPHMSYTWSFCMLEWGRLGEVISVWFGSWSFCFAILLPIYYVYASVPLLINRGRDVMC